LEYINFAVCVDAICELAAVFDVAAVDEDFDVVADLSLVVEHVAAHARPALEIALEQLRHRLGREGRRWALGVP
jgi:hypothetical protein